MTISDDERCVPEQDLIIYLTSIISWFKLQTARKSSKTDEIKGNRYTAKGDFQDFQDETQSGTIEK